MAEQIPSGIPVGIRNMIQTNMLSVALEEGLRPYSWFHQETDKQELPPHVGETMTHTKIGMFPVDLEPKATALADPSFATFPTEQYTAKPIPYANGFQWDAATAYVQVGNYAEQGITRLTNWAGMTYERLIRSKLYNYAGGQSIIRRAAAAGATSLLVNSLSGFRHVPTVNGLVAVSASPALPVFVNGVANTVVGVTPIFANFPDGPGTLTLGSGIQVGGVTAQMVVRSAHAPAIVRAAGRASTEAITAADVPTVKDILRMKGYLRGVGVPPHADGTYHLHVDETFHTAITDDPKWQTATNGMGPSAAFGEGALYVPGLGITIFDCNDSPAVGRGIDVAVGGTGVDGGTPGTPGASLSMKDLGIDVVNSSGVGIRRAVMTGRDCLIETRIDLKKYWEIMGVQQIAKIHDNLGVFQINGGRKVIAGEVEGWVISILPPLDVLQLQAKMGAQRIMDFTLATDINANTGGNTAAGNVRPIKRAIVLEYGNNEASFG